MPSKIIAINRAPVLTLWAAVVAKRLGFREDEALSLGQAVAGLTAVRKARSLGIIKPHEEAPQKARGKERGEEFWIELCGRPVPAKNTDEGIRSVRGNKALEPDSVKRYLENKFDENLAAARSAMEKLAKSYKPKELAKECYSLYEQFRPDIPAGTKGWGAEGRLDLGLIEKLAKRKR
jgi:hypothetical protein